MRERVLAILQSYVNFLLGWWLLVFLPWSFLLFSGMGRPSKTHSEGIPTEFAFAFDWVFPAAIFVYLGGALSVHLKEMLGNARSRLIPGLVRSHLVVAGGFTFVVCVALPALAMLLVDAEDHLLPAVASTLVAFTISVMVVHWLPAATPALFLLPLVLIAPQWSSLLASRLAAHSALIISISTLGLLTIAVRYFRFHEELPEYDRRVQGGMGWFSFQNATRQSLSAWSLSNPAPPIRNDLQRLARPFPVSQESLWQRAVHWDAAWGNYWRVAQQSLWASASLLATMALLGHPQYETRPPSLMSTFPLPLIMVATGAVAHLWTTMYWNRGCLVAEFARPYSRGQHLRSVAFVLATATFASFTIVAAAVLAIAGFTEWGWGLPPANRLFREAVFSVGALPLFVGAAAWPHPNLTWRTQNYFTTLAVFLPTMLVWFFVWDLGAWPFSVATLLLVLTGCCVSWRTYRRWLNDEVA